VPGVVEVGVEMMAVAVVAAVDAVLPVDDQDEAEDEAHDAPTPHPPCLGHAPVPPKKPPHEVPGARAEPLEPWVKRIYNDVYV